MRRKHSKELSLNFLLFTILISTAFFLHFFLTDSEKELLLESRVTFQYEINTYHWYGPAKTELSFLLKNCL